MGHGQIGDTGADMRWLAAAERAAAALERIAAAMEAASAPAAQKAPASLATLKPPAAAGQPGADAAENGSPPPGPDAPIREFLRTRGIGVKAVAVRQPETAEEALDQIACYMATRYDCVKAFHQRLKQNLGDGADFQMLLRNSSQAAISATCQLADLLHTIALLESYRYERAPKYRLSVKPSRLPTAINFLTGGWLERFVRVQASRTLGEAGFDAPATLGNAQVVLPNGDDFELDLLLQAGERVLWIEAKSGGYQQYVAKYSRIARMLDLPKADCFLVLPEIDAATAGKVTGLFGMTVCPIQCFAEVLRAALPERPAAEGTAEAPSPAPAPEGAAADMAL